MAPSATGGKGGVSRSGITEDRDGQRHIPSSVRADGSVRKEIRVRDGYRPPEDVDVYKNRTAEAFKNRGKGGVPGAEAVSVESTSAAANKNAKRREARKKAAASAATSNGDQDSQEQESESLPAGDSSRSEPKEPLDPEAEKVKEARKLSKKLRQARELQDKKEKGDSLVPEQFEKVIKINELIRQLDKLGFSADGEKKTPDP